MDTVKRMKGGWFWISTVPGKVSSRRPFLIIFYELCYIPSSIDGNDEVRRFINFEPSNQYMLFLRNCDGLNVSDKSFKVLKFDNNRITLEEEL